MNKYEHTLSPSQRLIDIQFLDPIKVKEINPGIVNQSKTWTQRLSATRYPPTILLL